MSLAAQQEVGDAVDAVNGTAHESVRSGRGPGFAFLDSKRKTMHFFSVFWVKFGMLFAPLSSAQLIVIGVDISSFACTGGRGWRR